MKIQESINQYNLTKDVSSLYENLYFSSLKLKEIDYVLQDVLGKNYSQEGFSRWKESKEEEDFDYQKYRAWKLDDGYSSEELYNMLHSNGDSKANLQESEEYIDPKTYKSEKSSKKGTFSSFEEWKRDFNNYRGWLKRNPQEYNALLTKINNLHRGQIIFALSRSAKETECKTRPYIIYCNSPYTEDKEYVYALPLIGEHKGEFNANTKNQDNHSDTTWYMKLPTEFEIGRKMVNGKLVGNQHLFTDRLCADISIFHHEIVEGFEKFRVAKKYIKDVADTTVYSTVLTDIDKVIDKKKDKRERLNERMRGVISRYLNSNASSEMKKLILVKLGYTPPKPNEKKIYSEDSESDSSYCGLLKLREDYRITDSGLLNVIKYCTEKEDDFNEIASVYYSILPSNLEKNSYYLWQVSDNANTFTVKPVDKGIFFKEEEKAEKQKLVIPKIVIKKTTQGKIKVKVKNE